MPDELLEIRDAAAAFEHIEEWLAGRGFFASGGEDLVADVYLGYGLSQSIRRNIVRWPVRAVSRASARRVPTRATTPCN